MSKKIIATIGGIPVYWDGKIISFTAGMTIDADGSPHAYHPDGSPPGLDYLANAGHPGNWWGIATNSRGTPYRQSTDDPAPGYYVSTTALMHGQYSVADPRRYIDSGTVPYVVIPSSIINLVAPVFMGCKATVKNTKNGKTSEAVSADIGPKSHAGEGSMELASLLGMQSSPKSGGTSKKIIEYKIYPGVPAVVNGVTYKLQPS